MLCSSCLVIAFANIYVVKEGEFKVIRQFGEIKDIKESPGLHMKIPFVQSVTTVPKYQMNYKLSEAEINTKDKRRIIIDNYAVWRVVNAKEMITSAGTLVKRVLVWKNSSIPLYVLNLGN